MGSTYYDNIVLRVKKPGEKDVDTRRVDRPDRELEAWIHDRVATRVVITAIDPEVPSISLSGPNNWTYSTRVADKDALKLVKVGDRLDIAWTEAVMLSTTAPK